MLELVNKHSSFHSLESPKSTDGFKIKVLIFRFQVKFEDKSEFMEINLYQTVGELKKFLRNFTQLSQSQFVVYYVEMFEGNTKDTTKLVLPNLSLLSLNMKIGDEIHIDRK